MIDRVGNRRFIIPAEVKGFFQRRKAWVHSVLLLIFLVLPWIKINGAQAVLLNIGQRQFHILGLHLRAHDAPLIFFVFLGLAMSLALVTALFGRVWCGWACPQTVFVESLFRKIEIWTEGNYIERRRLKEEALSFRKLRKVGLKWILYFFVSFIIAHSFLAYWTGSQELLQMMGSSPKENQFYFFLVMTMTGLILFDFGWFREQFCLIVCPYGRMQSVLQDPHTVTVMYDEKRGEPRKQVGKPPGGDCVACNRCVQVCPTGIDIRNGVQMECIGCTACIDACDEIMRKVKKPEGLIRYKALTTKKVNWFRPRVLTYFAILVVAIGGLGYSLSQSSSLRVELLRAHDVPYRVRTENGSEWIQNHFTLRLQNEGREALEATVRANRSDVRLILPQNPLTLGSNSKIDFPMFIEIPKESFIEEGPQLEVQVHMKETGEVILKRLQLVGPSF